MATVARKLEENTLFPVISIYVYVEVFLREIL